MIGKTISHYKILEKIGEGGMCVVYKAQDISLNCFVALKFLPPHLTKNESTRKRFIVEAHAASALEHPNICNIHEINNIKKYNVQSEKRLWKSSSYRIVQKELV
jgi:eukaryotic-like serine/threonine-protein kinase